MPTKKKDFTFKSTPEGAINMADDVPQVEHDETTCDHADAERIYLGHDDRGWYEYIITCAKCDNQWSAWVHPSEPIPLIKDVVKGEPDSPFYEDNDQHE